MTKCSFEKLSLRNRLGGFGNISGYFERDFCYVVIAFKHTAENRLVDLKPITEQCYEFRQRSVSDE